MPLDDVQTASKTGPHTLRLFSDPFSYLDLLEIKR